MKKNVQILLSVILFSLAVKAQQPVEVLYGGMKFTLPPNSTIENNRMYSTIPSVQITWPEELRDFKESHSFFALEYCDPPAYSVSASGHKPPKTVKEAAYFRAGLLGFKKHTDSIFTNSAYNLDYEVFILETKGIDRWDGKAFVSACYGIKTKRTDSIFYGSYFSNDLKKGTQTIKKIRAILLSAQVYNNTVVKKQPVPEKKLQTNIEDNKSITMLVKKIEGTDISVVLPQDYTNLVNIERRLSADYNNSNILYIAPRVRHTTTRDYVYDILSPVLKGNPLPENLFSETEAVMNTNGFIVYTYLTNVKIENEIKRFWISVRTEIATNTVLIFFMVYDPNSIEFKNSELPSWAKGLILGLTTPINK